ncbi:hypothetical protein BDN71DRAFT_459059 [Pleurotus eryngii]|uniref:Uncharacterized protein n=1 Tax=Pleurotus eryngii TaxID=5323 RepID=A0A9P5ZIN0_PLEER|nr:hypothetical protein BDN71DRAFT_459059 [Pleurotus eryngii]
MTTNHTCFHAYLLRIRPRKYPAQIMILNLLPRTSSCAPMHEYRRAVGGQTALSTKSVCIFEISHRSTAKPQDRNHPRSTFEPPTCGWTVYSTARRPCAYRGAYRDIDINTSGFPICSLGLQVWGRYSLFGTRLCCLVATGLFFHDCRLLWTRATSLGC